MKEVKVKLYKFEELPDKVRQEIVEKESFKVMDDVMTDLSSEFVETLKHFESATEFSAKHWEVGYGGNSYSVDSPDFVMGTYDYPISPEDCKGKLLFRWCLHFIENYRKGKYYGKLVHCEKSKEHPASLRHVKRHSKVFAEPIVGGWCPFTGVSTDCSIVEPIAYFYLNYHRGKFSENYSLKDLMEDCFLKFFSEWQSDYDYYGDDEDGCVERELIEMYSDELFYENGKKFNGVYEEVV